MAENCNHNCGSCSANCSERSAESLLASLNENSSVKKIIGIVSGKGGVGKSSVTALLASMMAQKGYRTAVLDADITGPSQGKCFGIKEKAMGDGVVIYPFISEKYGIQVMSVNMMLENDEVPVLWRGPILAGVVKQFYSEVLWQDVDYMFVDMPPGTGDVPLTVFQSIPLDGIIIVTSTQALAGMVVSKAINMANAMNIPVLGLLENMSYVECDNCHEKLYVFGESHIHEVADMFNLPILGRLPLKTTITKAIDEGTVEDIRAEELNTCIEVIEEW